MSFPDQEGIWGSVILVQTLEEDRQSKGGERKTWNQGDSPRIQAPYNTAWLVQQNKTEQEIEHSPYNVDPGGWVAFYGWFWERAVEFSARNTIDEVWDPICQEHSSEE